jgi:hypothetical protein
MSDSLKTFISRITLTVLLILLTWVKSVDTIVTDCEELGGFHINHKVYKCELVKK